MSFPRITSGLLVAALIVATGCNSNQSISSADGNAGNPSEPPAKVDLKIMSIKQVNELVASKKGKQIVVVDYWSTYCEPCKKEFPGLVALAEKHGAEIMCVSVSLDFDGAKGKSPEEKLERVKEFLVSQKATKVENVLSSDPTDDALKAIALDAPPGVFVYARDGALARKFDNSAIVTEKDNFTYADVTKLVEELIAKK